jgi:hypothetical protein
MTDLIRRFRGLGVALVVLALSAGAVFATAPRFSPAADTTTGVEQPDGDPAATDDADTDADEGDADEGEAGAEAGAEADAEGAAADTHGALVSEAAQASLDPRFDNRGEWVSCVAKLDKTVTLATVDWLQVTEDCATAAEAKDAAKDAAAAARAEAKAARAEAKAAREAARAEAKAARLAAKGQAKTHGHGKPTD